MDSSAQLLEAAVMKAESLRCLNDQAAASLTQPNRDETLSMFKKRALQIGSLKAATKYEYEFRQSFFISNSHSSMKNLNELTPITFKEMMLPKIHNGKYLVCRTVAPSYTMVGTGALVEDINGDVQEIVLYNFHIDLTEDSNKYLPEGTLLVIKEPYMKYSAQDAWKIRVDSPTDVIIVDEADDILKNTPWEIKDNYSLDELKQKGDEAYSVKDFKAALKYYKQAFKQSEDASVNLKKAETLLQLHKYTEAYNEAMYAYKKSIDSENTSLALGKAVYGIGRWQSAIEHFSEVLQLNADNKEAADKLEKARKRLDESQTGNYDFVSLVKESKLNKFALVDVADYNGKIEVCEIKGKGKGVIATDDIKKGTLLMASKAFSFTIEDGNDKIYCANLIGKRIDTYSQAINISQTCLKLKDNPDKAEQLYSLFAGEGEERNSNFPEGIVDAGRISKITSFNSFGFQDPLNVYSDGCFSGLWIMPSFINHSCLPNATYTYYGDLMVVCALKDIKKGEEVLISYASKLSSVDGRRKFYDSLEFTCDCDMCKTDGAEFATNYKKRQALLSEIFTLDKSAKAGQIKKKLKMAKENMETRKKYRFQLLIPLLKLVNTYMQNMAIDNINEAIKVCKEAIEIIGDQCDLYLSEFYVILFKCYHALGKKNDALENFKLAIESFKGVRGITQNLHQVFELKLEDDLKGIALESYLQKL